MSDLLSKSIEYTNRGWSVIPIPHKSKAPRLNGWQKLRLTTENLPKHFNGKPQNIGVLLGEPSGWLIDIDLDHPVAVELAPEYLPPTSAVFGRAGKQRSHYLYRATGPIETKKFSSNSEGMLAELRSTGQQTVLPPSTHVSGEAIEWNEANPEPALVDPEELQRCVAKLAAAVKERIGELPANVCLDAMLRMNMADGKDGSKRLFAAACRVVEHDLSDQDGLALIRQYEQQRPFPRQWSDKEILQRYRDAEKKVERGTVTERPSGFAKTGERDPKSGKLVLSPKKTLPTAEAYVDEFHTHPEGRTLYCHNGVLLHWEGNRYVELEDGAAKNKFQRWLHDALMYKTISGKPRLVQFEANPRTVNSALESIRTHVHLLRNDQRSLLVTAAAWRSAA
ncbi:hypothetical protein CA54_60620 [Symmachiella macrocystis]|uniref:DNA primase/polymerase bifunctional N-terminal domain-containing protein n=1 Tax=Symmachiella macrocystis TaxID=2527985 RepID=A0A5C6AWR2_9PLAN|nr:bifunctional DNA primase/polymerase [Symmachiella macrocystis]TWU04180.1 hypothetical protein CA54_60620 [Symmachiella macrocystis]